MSEVKAVATDFDLITAYGHGVAPLWSGIMNKKSVIKRIGRFSSAHFQSSNAATVPGLDYHKDKSLSMQMLEVLFKESAVKIPKDAFLILATAVGEIDLLEKSVFAGQADAGESRLAVLLEKAGGLLGLDNPGMVISCACASSSAALGLAASLIQSGKNDCVLVVAVDAVTEFVFSGFSSLMALDPDRARPFDKNRAGLSLGEGAGYILLMSRERAEKENREISGEVSGWATAGDANHMTGPSRDGSGLRLAIEKALRSAGVSSADVGCISSHGTGTLYNDSMEMKAYSNVFDNRPVALYSIKGAAGHTMGAAGLIETIIALRVLQERIIPPTVGLADVDPEAKDWASLKQRKLEKNVILLNNAGFGGINAALVLKR